MKSTPGRAGPGRGLTDSMNFPVDGSKRVKTFVATHRVPWRSSNNHPGTATILGGLRVSGPRACRRCYEYLDVERLASPNQFRTNFVPASEKFDSTRSPLGAPRQALPALLRLAR